MSGNREFPSVDDVLEDGDEVDHPEEVGGQFLVSCCDAAEFFQPADGPFHDVSLSVTVSVKELVLVLVASPRDHVLDVSFVQPVSNGLRGIAFVARKPANGARQRARFQTLHQRLKLFRFVLLSRTDRDSNDPAHSIHDNMQFRSESASGASQSVVGRFKRRPVFSPRPLRTCEPG